LNLFIKKVDKTDCGNYRGISLDTNYMQSFIQYSCLKVVDKIIGDHQCDFEHNIPTADQYSLFHIHWRENGSTIRQYITYIIPVKDREGIMLGSAYASTTYGM
jgi:hypothetical protein